MEPDPFQADFLFAEDSEALDVQRLVMQCSFRLEVFPRLVPVFHYHDSASCSLIGFSTVKSFCQVI